LSAYPNRGIHANHMDITRYSDPQDAGYRAVSDQLWLWVNDIETEIEEDEKRGRPPKPRNF